MPFKIVRNDITKMQVDAIVNPTNSQLYGTAGVDGAIHKIEGPWLREETAKNGNVEHGQSVLTKAKNLPAANIIHTVGPVWQTDSTEEVEVLISCYRTSLDLAKKHELDSIAFPLISSGAYGCPKDISLNTAVNTIGEFLLFNDMTVYLVVFDRQSYQISESLYSAIDAYIDDHYVDDHVMMRRARVQESECLYDAMPSSAFLDKITSAEKSKKRSLEDLVDQLDETFSDMLLRLIDERGLKDPVVYKKANVTKQTFSKIRNNKNYNPTKTTVLAFAVALELSLDEAKDLLLKAGYALSKSNRFDIIMSYFFEEENYDIFLINQVLFQYDQNLLGV